MPKRLPIYTLILMTTITMAAQNIIIDDRKNNDLESALGTHWRLITDEVMGGISTGRLHTDHIEGKACLRLSGDVRMENNGGFVQAALDLGQTTGRDASSFEGVLIEVIGNPEDYNLHLRTGDAWLPWQSYRSTFQTTPSWQIVKLPFDRFVGYRIDQP